MNPKLFMKEAISQLHQYMWISGGNLQQSGGLEAPADVHAACLASRLDGSHLAQEVCLLSIFTLNWMATLSRQKRRQNAGGFTLLGKQRN
jgi:hypothetical protein